MRSRRNAVEKQAELAVDARAVNVCLQPFIRHGQLLLLLRSQLLRGLSAHLLHLLGRIRCQRVSCKATGGRARVRGRSLRAGLLNGRLLHRRILHVRLRCILVICQLLRLRCLGVLQGLRLLRVLRLHLRQVRIGLPGHARCRAREYGLPRRARLPGVRIYRPVQTLRLFGIVCHGLVALVFQLVYAAVHGCESGERNS